jgi:hypothetical protein
MKEDWQTAESKVEWYATCPVCGREGMKKKMFTLHIRKGTYNRMRVLCHVCPDCMQKVLDGLKAEMPEGVE